MRELAELGEYFAFDARLPSEVLEPPWLPLRFTEVTVATRIEQVQAALTAGRPADQLPPSRLLRRAAASVAQLGLTARLVAPVLGAAVLSSTLLELNDLYWQLSAGGAFPLSLPIGDAERVRDQRLVDNLATIVTVGPVRELCDLTIRRSVSPITAWGNVASAINGAISMIARSPDHAPRARIIGRAVLTHAPLTAAWTGEVAGDFRRHSCCQLYRLADGGLRHRTAMCADCVLA